MGATIQAVSEEPFSMETKLTKTSKIVEKTNKLTNKQPFTAVLTVELQHDSTNHKCSATFHY